MREVKRRKLPRQALQAAERERRRLARELHDGLGQRLTEISVLFGVLSRKLSRTLPPETLAGTAKLRGDLAVAIEGSIRQARAITRRRRPELPEPQRLPGLLRRLVRRSCRLFSIDCRTHTQFDPLVLSRVQAFHLYRIAKEAVHNAAKHGRGSKMLVELLQEGDSLTLRVANDGPKLPTSHPLREGVGIRAMRQRAERMGADWRVATMSTGGIRVECQLPLRNRRHNTG